MVRPLPDEYVERKELYAQMKARLLSADEAAPHHSDQSAHVVTCIGEGGFGKTTLIEALGLDIDVNETFSGGVLFATIGEEGAQLAQKWTAMLSALTGDEATVSDPIEQLKLKSQGDDFLIILDDVWDVAHIEPILRLPRCTYLISTRDERVAALATHSPVRVTEMTPTEARDVLILHIPQDKRANLTEAQRQALQDFGGQLGEWPLLLDIHGWAIREECQRASSVESALNYVKEGLREVGLDPFPRGRDDETRRKTLQGSMSASLRRYSDEEKRRLYELAIFPDDTPIPEATALKLWQGTCGMASFMGKALLRCIAGHFAASARNRKMTARRRYASMIKSTNTWATKVVAGDDAGRVLLLKARWGDAP